MKICPITGELCQKKKFFHITEIENDEVSELHLCESCIKEYLTIENLPLPPSSKPKEEEFIEEIKSFLSELFGQNFIEEIDLSKKCPSCGHTLEDIKNNKMLGCPNCYSFFGDQIQPLLQSIHGEIKHVGKVPKEWKIQQEIEEIPDILKSIKIKMDKLVEKEKYEKAAVIRDNLPQIEKLGHRIIRLQKSFVSSLEEKKEDKAKAIKELIVSSMEEFKKIESICLNIR
jgi:protein arginine kinase activator